MFILLAYQYITLNAMAFYDLGSSLTDERGIKGWIIKENALNWTHMQILL